MFSIWHVSVGLSVSGKEINIVADCLDHVNMVFNVNILGLHVVTSSIFQSGRIVSLAFDSFCNLHFLDCLPFGVSKGISSISDELVPSISCF